MWNGGLSSNLLVTVSANHSPIVGHDVRDYCLPPQKFGESQWKTVHCSSLTWELFKNRLQTVQEFFPNRRRAGLESLKTSIKLAKNHCISMGVSFFCRQCKLNISIFKNTERLQCMKFAWNNKKTIAIYKYTLHFTTKHLLKPHHYSNVPTMAKT